jgi:hypothetical protein
MNYQGTPGRIRVIQFDQNNARIDFDPSIVAYVNESFSSGVYNEVTVDSTGRVVAGTFNQPIIPVIPTVKQTNPPVVYTADPNVEGLTPLDSTQPCVAYSADGSLAFFGWDTTNLVWV